MSKTWYPIVNYVKCNECGTCVEKCPHKVYDVKKTPAPVDINPERCVQGCHGCGNRCPNGVII